MSEAYEERLHAERIKAANQPNRLGDETVEMLSTVIGTITGVIVPERARILTLQFLAESHAKVAARGLDDECFESSNHFLRAMTLDTLDRAQEYKSELQAKRNYARKNRTERDRNEGDENQRSR